jgi:hypothetical protein
MPSYCTECGALRGEGETFCTNCAARFPDGEDTKGPGPVDAISDPPGHGAKWYLGLTVALAVIVAAGLVGAYALFGRRGTASGPPDFSATVMSTPPDTSTSDPTATETPTPTFSDEPTPTPTFTTSTPYAGNATVAVAPQAADHPATRAAVALLSNYFIAINRRDYAAFRQLHTPAERAKLNRKQFTTGYRSTHDSEIQLSEMGAAADGRLRAVVVFVSTQNSADGPKGQTCTRWTVGKFLEVEGSSLRIGKTPPGSTTYTAC